MPFSRDGVLCQLRPQPNAPRIIVRGSTALISQLHAARRPEHGPIEMPSTKLTRRRRTRPPPPLTAPLSRAPMPPARESCLRFLGRGAGGGRGWSSPFMRQSERLSLEWSEAEHRDLVSNQPAAHLASFPPVLLLSHMCSYCLLLVYSAHPHSKR